MTVEAEDLIDMNQPEIGEDSEVSIGIETKEVKPGWKIEMNWKIMNGPCTRILK